MRVLAALLVLIPAVAGATAGESPQINTYLLCKNKGYVRSVYVQVSESGCQTHYTKQGRPEVIGSGIHTASCVQFLNNVRTNLEGAHWSCRDVAKAHVSSEL